MAGQIGVLQKGYPYPGVPAAVNDLDQIDSLAEVQGLIEREQPGGDERHLYRIEAGCSGGGRSV